MKRSIFFWLDKLRISRTERRTISYLLILLVFLMVVNTIISPSASFDREYYHELDKQFRKRTALMKQENQELMSRYEGEIAQNHREQVDTLPQTDTKEAESADQLSAGTPISINQADSKTLQVLNGIGAAYAQRIINYRQENGLFSSKKQLLKINGIGPARLENIIPFITLDDSGSVGSAVSNHTIERAQVDKTQSEQAEPKERQSININTSDEKTLQKLPGIGSAYARRIVDYRQKSGPFKSKDELLKIKGIGKKRLVNIQPFIKLKGQQ